MKKINIHIVPIHVKNCIRQIFETSGESAKKFFKESIKPGSLISAAATSLIISFLLLCSLIVMQVQIIPSVNARAAITNCAGIDIWMPKAHFKNGAVPAATTDPKPIARLI